MIRSFSITSCIQSKPIVPILGFLLDDVSRVDHRFLRQTLGYDALFEQEVFDPDGFPQSRRIYEQSPPDNDRGVETWSIVVLVEIQVRLTKGYLMRLGCRKTTRYMVPIDGLTRLLS